MIEGIIDAVHEAASSASLRATSAIRRRAWESGWPGSAARTLSVEYDRSRRGWKATGSADAAGQEYGGPGRTPNAAVRQFRTHSKVLESAFMSELSQRLKGVL